MHQDIFKKTENPLIPQVEFKIFLEDKTYQTINISLIDGVYMMLNSALSVSKSNLTLLNEDSELSGKLNKDRKDFYTINENFFLGLDLVNDLAHDLIHEEALKVMNKMKETSVILMIVSIAIFILHMVNIIISAIRLSRVIANDQAIFLTVPQEEIDMLLQNADKFVKGTLMEYKAIVEYREKQKELGDKEFDYRGSEASNNEA